jgi:hypothetical protein
VVPECALLPHRGERKRELRIAGNADEKNVADFEP